MVSPFRIAIISFYPWDITKIAGGTRMAAYLLVEGLRRHPELDIHVIHCHSDISEDGTRQQGNLTVHYLAMPRRRLIPNMMSAIERVARLLAEIQPQIVHAHLHIYAVAALQAGFEPVWTIHGIPAREARYASGPAKKTFSMLSGIMAGRYEHRAFSRVREITTVNPCLQRYYAGKTAARWHLVENPVADELFSLERQLVKGRLLMPASVIPIKDPVTMVRALAAACSRFPHLHLQIAGRVDQPRYLRVVKETARRLGVAGRVEFLGLQSQARMRLLFSQAELLVLSSREEVSPIAAIEGLAAGIPVITTDAGGASYIVEDGAVVRVVEVGDAEALAEAVCQVLGDRALYRTMSENARSTAERRFRKDRIADDYLAVYQLAEEGARAAQVP
jgi:glycosyltransferase involved in cell wall biosynthesis